MATNQASPEGYDPAGKHELHESTETY
jgi:hypothetical protein